MKICHVDPACGLSIPPKNWGAIEKIIWEFEENQRKLGHESCHKFGSEIQPGEFDIVHCHVANLAVELAARGIPYIYQLHDHHVLHYGKESEVYKLNLEAIRGSLIALMPSRELVDYFNEPECNYFSHGVNTDKFFPTSVMNTNNPKLLMVANNGLGGVGGYDRKGFGYGIALAMKNNLEITIVGPRNNENYFNENLAVFAYPKLNIIWEPDNEDLPYIYNDHDIFLHPSELEAGHPNLTILEAAACGLPIIGWIEEATDFHGLWRAPRNIFRMEEGLKDILAHPATYVHNAIRTAQTLSWKNRTRHLIEIYKLFI